MGDNRYFAIDRSDSCATLATGSNCWDRAIWEILLESMNELFHSFIRLLITHTTSIVASSSLLHHKMCETDESVIDRDVDEFIILDPKFRTRAISGCPSAHLRVFAIHQHLQHNNERINTGQLVD